MLDKLRSRIFRCTTQFSIGVDLEIWAAVLVNLDVLEKLVQKSVITLVGVFEQISVNLAFTYLAGLFP